MVTSLCHLSGLPPLLTSRNWHGIHDERLQATPPDSRLPWAYMSSHPRSPSLGRSSCPPLLLPRYKAQGQTSTGQEAVRHLLPHCLCQKDAFACHQIRNPSWGSWFLKSTMLVCVHEWTLPASWTLSQFCISLIRLNLSMISFMNPG